MSLEHASFEARTLQDFRRDLGERRGQLCEGQLPDLHQGCSSFGFRDLRFRDFGFTGLGFSVVHKVRARFQAAGILRMEQVFGAVAYPHLVLVLEDTFTLHGGSWRH